MDKSAGSSEARERTDMDKSAGSSEARERTDMDKSAGIPHWNPLPLGGLEARSAPTASVKILLEPGITPAGRGFSPRLPWLTLRGASVPCAAFQVREHPYAEWGIPMVSCHLKPFKA